ncbi:hypothetical protein [Parvibaculum sp.]|uniref:hypothetical protein n=1 Tax=Parvibaculum sp. TaxID=2024848 RepID=UPI0026080E43|nr:hypothetical protein [Parvibaculum sp.]MCW5727252.1 hypothetical protein [Parvibaculum sp.]
MSPASWLRAGMSGVETGLDMTQALARMPEGVSAHAVRRLLEDCEGDVRAAMADRRESLNK